MTAQETSERELLAIEAKLKARAFCFVRPNGDHEAHFGFTEAEVAIIQSALAATRAAGDAPAWDNRVICLCKSCDENDPESGGHLREAIGVMPDGTWLCEDCYRECDNREYGMQPSNDPDADFIYPDFDDLPRPTFPRPDRCAPESSAHENGSAAS